MRQLIVNADDFGLTEAVSSGILDAHRNGIVTSTTLMANGEAFDAAVAMSRRAPRLGIGVHLNLTSGKPVSPAQRIPSLIDRRGRLHWSRRPLAAGYPDAAGRSCRYRNRASAANYQSPSRRDFADPPRRTQARARYAGRFGYCHTPGSGVFHSDVCAARAKYRRTCQLCCGAEIPETRWSSSTW